MLQSLRVRNLAIVEDASVDFEHGLNVITGETGAGKSIIIGALDLILGERADKSLIRNGETKCTVEAIFQLRDASDIDAKLDELDIEPCENGRLLIRRTVSAGGGGKNTVNDAATTLNALKEIGDLLVDMHGPHDHQSLLNEGFQMDLLDAFGHLWGPREAYEKPYRARLDLLAQRRELEQDDSEIAQRIDLLEYQIKEIEEADLQPDEEEEIEREHAMQANAQRLLELAGGIRAALTDDDAAAFNNLAFVLNHLTELARILPDAEAWRDEAQSLTIQVQELSNTIGQRVERFEADPQRLQWLDDRLTLLHRLKRKYGAAIPEILAFLEQAKDRLQGLASRGERLAEIDQKLSAINRQLTETGEALSAKRNRAARDLGDAVTAELKSLGFPNGAFAVTLQPADPAPNGMDEITLGFAPNVGEPMRPLRIIASSGEVSRVMLATKAVLANHDRIPVLIFDEIDANVGGEMGHAIGEKLAGVAQNHQVLCITHLPQVAVHGPSHFVVAKSVSEGRTHTHIERLDAETRAEEVARMLGGRDQTDVTLEHARQMLASRS